MTTDLVRATDANPFLDLCHDGVWSLRACWEAQRGLHVEYRDLKNARDRAYHLVELQWGVSAAQAAFVDVPKCVNGRTFSDYDTEVNALGLMATCQKSGLPDIDAWFVMVGLEKLLAPKPTPQPASKVGATDLTSRQLGTLAKQLAPLAPETQYLLAQLATQQPAQEFVVKHEYDAANALAQIDERQRQAVVELSIHRAKLGDELNAQAEGWDAVVGQRDRAAWREGHSPKTAGVAQVPLSNDDDYDPDRFPKNAYT